MYRTNTSPYIPEALGNSWYIELLPKQYNSLNEALYDSHRQINFFKSNRYLGESASCASPDENVLLFKTTNQSYTEKCSKQKGDIIVPAQCDGVKHSACKGISLDNSSSSEEATTHTDMSDNITDWEQLAKDRGVEIHQL